MPIMATAGESQTFTPAPEGVHQAVCVDIIDLGVIPGFEGKPQHKIDIVWQIGKKRDDGKRFELRKRYTLSLYETANLSIDLISWRGKPFTPAELKAFDVERVKGANCLISVQHKPSKKDPNKKFANVVSVMPLMEGMPKIAADGYVRYAKPEEQDNTPEYEPEPGNEPPSIMDEPPF